MTVKLKNPCELLLHRVEDFGFSRFFVEKI